MCAEDDDRPGAVQFVQAVGHAVHRDVQGTGNADLSPFVRFAHVEQLGRVGGCEGCPERSNGQLWE